MNHKTQTRKISKTLELKMWRPWRIWERTSTFPSVQRLRSSWQPDQLIRCVQQRRTTFVFIVGTRSNLRVEYAAPTYRIVTQPSAPGHREEAQLVLYEMWSIISSSQVRTTYATSGRSSTPQLPIRALLRGAVRFSTAKKGDGFPITSRSYSLRARAVTWVLFTSHHIS